MTSLLKLSKLTIIALIAASTTNAARPLLLGNVEDIKSEFKYFDKAMGIDHDALLEYALQELLDGPKSYRSGIDHDALLEYALQEYLDGPKSYRSGIDHDALLEYVLQEYLDGPKSYRSGID
eukprot:494477_1